jgi:ABC-type transporter Mla MlaB component
MATTKKSSRKTAAAAAVPAQPAEQPAEQPTMALSDPVHRVVEAAAGPARGSSVLQLGSSLSIREVSECAVQLKSMLANGPLDVDVSRLETIDTAGIQLLLAAAAAAQRRGFKLKLLGGHALKGGAARSLGLSEHLSELAEILQ